MGSRRTAATDSPGSGKRSTDLLQELVEEFRGLRFEMSEYRQEMAEFRMFMKNREEEREKNIQLESKVNEARQKYITDWTNTLEKRKKAYYSYLVNDEKARIFEEYLTKEPIFIPKHCREKTVRG